MKHDLYSGISIKDNRNTKHVVIVVATVIEH